MPDELPTTAVPRRDPEGRIHKLMIRPDRLVQQCVVNKIAAILWGVATQILTEEYDTQRQLYSNSFGIHDMRRRP
jgi:hypothetical protein